MSHYIDGSTDTYAVAGAIGKHILVKISAAKTIDVAGLADEHIGTLDEAAFAAGDVRSVTLRNKQGTMNCVAAGAFAVGAVIYGRALGKADDIATSSAVRLGIAKEAATAAGDIIEYVPD